VRVGERSPESFLQRQDEEEEDEPIQTKESGGHAPALDPPTESAITAMKGGGHALTDAERVFFNDRFNHDFSGVRVHADSQSGGLARTIRAKAFTVGSHIFFGQGEYSPNTSDGRRLLAHELTHVVQQTAPGGGNSLSMLRRPMNDEVQRQADIDQAPPGLPCTLITGSGHLEGSHLLFERSGSVLNANQIAAITAFVQRWVADGSRDDIQVDGYASIDGTQQVNWQLSCARAASVRDELLAQGVPAAKISIAAHGETTEFSAADPVRNRRAIISRHVPAGPAPAPAPAAAAPQLRAVVNTGPDPVNCGGVNFVINWNLSRNAAAQGGFIIQNVTFTWNVRDCNGASVPNPDPRTSPLRYFEAWRVAPNSTTLTPVTTDTFFWPDNAPWAGRCTVGNVRILATARYHDNVAALPAHMIANNPATFAGTLQSSLTDPALGGTQSRAVEHRLLFRWTCCPCSSRRTIVDAHTP